MKTTFSILSASSQLAITYMFQFVFLYPVDAVIYMVHISDVFFIVWLTILSTIIYYFYTHYCTFKYCYAYSQCNNSVKDQTSLKASIDIFLLRDVQLRSACQSKFSGKDVTDPQQHILALTVTSQRLWQCLSLLKVTFAKLSAMLLNTYRCKKG